MKRRAFLASSALGGVALAGCLQGGGATTPTAETDGYPPESTGDDRPPEREIDTAAFGHVEVDGTQVPLAPLDVAYYWFRRREARFADARGQRQYERSRILGAVLSTAGRNSPDDPVKAWPKGDRIVCYCGCPHHLSSIRAAAAIDAGYESVFVIDEGFWAWHDSGYPMAGNDVGDQPASYAVSGRVAPAHAGEMVRVSHEPTGQLEAAPVDADGSYTVHLRFSGVARDSMLTVATPEETVRRPLGELVVDG
jgi:rhodanese-related sulfurtransferase